MTYDDVPRLYRDTWAVYEALRKFGFRDEQIEHVASPVVYPDGTRGQDDHISVILTVDEKQCTFIIGKLDRPFEEARDLLERIRIGIADHSIDDTTLERLWTTSAMGHHEAFQSVAVTLLNKGIEIPMLKN